MCIVVILYMLDIIPMGMNLLTTLSMTEPARSWVDSKHGPWQGPVKTLVVRSK